MAKSPKKAAPKKAAPKKAAPKKAKGGRPSARSKPTKQAKGPSRSAGPRGQTYEIICSECYTDFSFNQASNESSITCPECLHTGNVAPKDVMSKIAIAKSSEAGNLMKAFIPGILFLLCGVVWITILNTQETVSPGVNYGLLGGTLVLLIVAIAMGVKYEYNLHDVYF